ncbi:MOSC domain-containing protein [Arthrobacter sp. Bz4]|uniref:MOSC domain-containing protein n=1 Tax=Arthrobacter sp. Bz4 TaxID=2171979 RepID=UPI000D511BE2|nr:MOSC domain-containing protein [Arthrobacter sp. Bz4]PVE15050.1 MOSC domain-containing protein [Arthrobacter sp. Bz4]
MTTGSLLAVCTVHELLPTKDSTGVTAIDKRAVDGPVAVHKLGLTGDIQASRKHHGGESKALYAYSQQDADFWDDQLGRTMSPGMFGENLRVDDIDASHAVIGERWQVGDDVVLEVTAPRTPCVNFARFVKEPAWVRRFAEANRVGTYLRVITKGKIQAGDTVTVLQRPEHGITGHQVFAGLDVDAAQQLLVAEKEGVTLSPEIHKVVASILRRA